MTHQEGLHLPTEGSKICVLEWVNRPRRGAFNNFWGCAMVQRTIERVTYDPPLDPGIERTVNVLRAHGVETFESCEGSHGHAYTEPTVRFHGDTGEGFRALGVALEAGLEVADLRRVWRVQDGEPNGPWWELVFSPHQGR